ncbi:hypothetical protein MASR2M66_03220 [Chloroflexota bacterium]
MIITSPNEIDEPLYEDTLDIVSTSGRLLGDEVFESGGPAVTFGIPQSWKLVPLLRENNLSLSPDMLLQAKDADFYLAELAVSFRPQKNSTITWSQFTAYLRPGKTGVGVPIAYDLFPKALTHEKRSEIKLEVSPEIKFSEIEFKVGELSTLIKYENLIPIVTGYGLLEPAPTWEFQNHANYPLQGCRACYLIIKKPKGSGAVRVILDVSAEIVISGRLFNAKRKKNHSSHCTHVICKD